MVDCQFGSDNQFFGSDPAAPGGLKFITESADQSMQAWEVVKK
jgi:hypothetical protein